MTPWQPLQLTLNMGLVLEFNPQGIEFHPNALLLMKAKNTVVCHKRILHWSLMLNRSSLK